MFAIAIHVDLETLIEFMLGFASDAEKANEPLGMHVMDYFGMWTVSNEMANPPTGQPKYFNRQNCFVSIVALNQCIMYGIQN